MSIFRARGVRPKGECENLYPVACHGDEAVRNELSADRRRFIVMVSSCVTTNPEPRSERQKFLLYRLSMRAMARVNIPLKRFLIFIRYKKLGRIDNFTIAMVGDLRYGRTIHSLVYLLSLSQKVNVCLVSPKELRLPFRYKTFLNAHKIPFREFDTLKNVLPKTDILYMTRIQKERFSLPSLYERVKDSFVLDKKSLAHLKKNVVIMHPLPRVNEIDKDVDADSREAYFRQARNGLYIRMALLAIILKASNPWSKKR